MNYYLVVVLIWSASIFALAYESPNLLGVEIGAGYSVGLYIMFLMGIPEAIAFSLRRAFSKTELCSICGKKLTTLKVSKTERQSQICKECNIRHVDHFGVLGVYGLSEDEEEKFFKRLREEEK